MLELSTTDVGKYVWMAYTGYFELDLGVAYIGYFGLDLGVLSVGGRYDPSTYRNQKYRPLYPP